MRFSFLKHLKVLTLIESMIIELNTRTSVIISILVWFILHLSAPQLHAQDDRGFFLWNGRNWD
jgi:hypothetical protein